MKLKDWLSAHPLSFTGRLFAKEAKLMVVSEQEDAEIFIDGISTGKITPALVKVPLGYEVKVELRLMAHKPYSKMLRINAPMTYHYCLLERETWTVYPEEQSPWHFVPPAAGPTQTSLRH